MRAAVHHRYGGPDVLRLAEVPTPSPGEGEALVRVRAASVNTADLDLLIGRPRVARIGTGLRRPSSGRAGLDVAGTVEQVGPGVTGLAAGDHVWADLFDAGRGSFAEYVCAPAAAFAPMPVGAAFDEAAAVPHSGVLALRGLRPGRAIRPGDRVLIVGAGGCVGPFAVQIAKARGAEVTAVDAGGKLDFLRKLGADHVVDYTEEDVTAGEQRFDRILDIAEAHSVLRYRRCLRPGGTHSLVARTLSGFAATAVLGGVINLVTDKRMGVFDWRPNVREDLAELADLLDRGLVKPVLDRRFTLDETPEAYRHAESGKARGKVIVTPPG